MTERITASARKRKKRDERIVELYSTNNDGQGKVLLMQMISDRVGVSVSTVYNVLRRAGYGQ